MILKDSQNCAKVLLSLGIPDDEITAAGEIWSASPELREALCSRSVTVREKYAVCDKLFSKRVSPFIKVMCEFGHIEKLDSIFSAYKLEKLKSENVLPAKLYYVNRPDSETVERLKKALCKKYKADGVELSEDSDPSLFGGYLLCVGDTEYDKSISGTVKALHKKLIRR